LLYLSKQFGAAFQPEGWPVALQGGRVTMHQACGVLSERCLHDVQADPGRGKTGEEAPLPTPMGEDQGGVVLCKPWSGRIGRAGLFKKADFKIDMRAKTITCPAGQVEPIEEGQAVEFDPEQCGACRLRNQCTYSASGGRTIQINQDERRQQRLRHLTSTRSGRKRLRERVGVEHKLAHIAARKGPKARYLGIRANLFDLRRAASIQNLETIQRMAA
jgi:hypothetical protein